MGHLGYASADLPPSDVEDEDEIDEDEDDSEGMQFYTAGSSKELPRAKAAMAKMIAAGFVNTCDWTKSVEAAIAAGKKEADLPDDERGALTDMDLEAVLNSDVVWLLVSGPDAPTRGAWVEFGFALALVECMGAEMLIVASGPHVRDTIFTSRADACFETDEEAFAYIRKEMEADA